MSHREVKAVGKFLSALSVVFSAVGFSALAHADRVVLTSGDVIEGKATRKDGKVVVELESGQIAVPADTVKRIEKSESQVSRVEARRASLAPTDVKGRLELADYCRDHDMHARERELLQQVLELDTNNETARLRLGYVKTESGWATKADAMRAQGLVERGGRWLTPDQAHAADLQAEAEASARDREETEAELSTREAQLAAQRAQMDAQAEAERNRTESEQFHNDYWYGGYGVYGGYYAPGYGAAYRTRWNGYGVPRHGAGPRDTVHPGFSSSDLSVVKVPYAGSSGGSAPGGRGRR